MALLRKLFARKAMDGLSCISERVYVFNSCLSTEPLVDNDDDDEEVRNDHLISTVIQLKSCHPHDASLMLLNLFAAGETSLLPVDALLRHGVAAITEYPCHHRHAPSLPLATTRALLATCVDWLVTDGQLNVLLMRCDRGAWPALALAMASLLVYMEEPGPPERVTTTTLAAMYGRAPVALLAAGSALDPRPSHLRYLQYVTRLRRMTRHEPPPPLLILDCLILRPVPDFDGNGGCRPVVRVHGRRGDDDDGDQADDASLKILFSTPRIKQRFRQYNQVMILL
uniref:C2 tensin-type domain-containing protein n=1 Tax=Oryza punctata TaxID=4537 RepID=A0A0E0KFB0_ORYPU